MSDAFQKNWVELMKTDELAHSIMNNTATWHSDLTYQFVVDPALAGGVRMTRPIRTQWKSTQFKGAPWRSTWIAKGRPSGRHRYDNRLYRTWVGDNNFKYYENMIPKRSLYDTPTVSRSVNPIIETISYKEI